MNSSKIKSPHFFQNHDFTFEKVKSLTPGKTTSNLNYLSFEMTNGASLHHEPRGLPHAENAAEGLQELLEHGEQ